MWLKDEGELGVHCAMLLCVRVCVCACVRDPTRRVDLRKEFGAECNKVR